ncbi:MAG TPA: MFS transporter [Polyangiaceae bacterium]
MQSAQRDRTLLGVAGFLRATATSTAGITLGLHLGRLGLEPRTLGVVLSAGLSGAALAALLATLFADRLGRRRFLLAVATLGALGTAIFAVSSEPLVLGVAAFAGMLNGMGRDRGAALILETSMLPSTTDDRGRTRVIALYTMLQDLGHGLGAALVGASGFLAERHATAGPGHGYRALLLGCAALSAAGVLIYARLGAGLEVDETASRETLTPESRGILARLSALFALDSLGGGFLTSALLSYFFFERFGAGPGAIGALFLGARLLNALSHLGAAWLAGRIGLVNTMVFTHIPSSVLLASVAFAPNFPIAAALFLLREGLVEMDVPTRQSYVLAVVRPEERTFANGITNLVRLGSWAVAPSVAGLLMSAGSLHTPLVAGAGMKILYDLLLWRAFRKVKPPEER